MSTDSVPRTQEEAYLDAAARIGERLCASAEWSNDQCTWTHWVWGTRVAIPTSAPSDGSVYSGTAGIALFLCELDRKVGCRRVRRTAQAALRHACFSHRTRAAVPDCGLYQGWPGVVLAAARCAHVWHDDEAAALAMNVAGANLDFLRNALPTDLVTGAAGGILALIGARAYLPISGADKFAEHLGDYLMSVAMRRPSGWSWETIAEPLYDDLVGYAHGTAGIGHALRTLAHATGNGRYEFAADEAERHERRYFDSAHGLWEDLRIRDDDQSRPNLTDTFGISSKRTHSRSAERYSLTWCHGVTGIGLARIRALELGAGESLLDDVRTAASAVGVWDETNPGGYCLCHGGTSNAEFLREAADVLHDPTLAARADAYAMRGYEEFELRERTWPTAPCEKSTPELMTGEAGIGYFYLRMADLSVPPIIALRAVKRAVRGVLDDGYRDQRDQMLEVACGESLDACAASSVARSKFAARIHSRRGSAPIHVAAARVLDDIQLARGDDRLSRLYRNALSRETAHAELLDLPNETPRKKAQTPEGPQAGNADIRVRLSPRARIVSSAADVDDATSNVVARELLVRRGRKVHRLPVSPFVAAVLEACAPGGIAACEIVRGLNAVFDTAEQSSGEIAAAVEKVIEMALRSGVLLNDEEAS